MQDLGQLVRPAHILECEKEEEKQSRVLCCVDTCLQAHLRQVSFGIVSRNVNFSENALVKLLLSWLRALDEGSDPVLLSGELTDTTQTRWTRAEQ